MKTAIIRVDSSIEIGSGHVMRCLTLARDLHENGYKVTFVTRKHEGNLINYILSSEFDVIELKKPLKNGKFESQLQHSQWLGTSQEEDAKDTLRELKTFKSIDLLVVDHYAIDYNWERFFRNIAKRIFIIDDLADRKHECDVLLDQNFYLNMKSRYDALVNKDCKLMLGPKYALLRKEFKEAREQIKERNGKIKRILVFFGGSDLTNETTKALHAIQLLNRKDITFDVVVGASNPYKEKVKILIDSIANVNYHYQVSNMANLMLKADMSIGAGGSTTWERCCLGLPSLIIVVAENQRETTIDLAKTKAIVYLGSDSNVTVGKLFKELNNFITDSEVYLQVAKGSKKIVDGNGSKRVINVINKMC